MIGYGITGWLLSCEEKDKSCMWINMDDGVIYDGNKDCIAFVGFKII